MKNTIGSYDPNNDVDKDDNGQSASEIQELGPLNIICKPIMLSANGKTYERIEPFIKYVRSLKIDSEVNLKVCDAKGENKKQVKITLRPLN